MLSIVIPTFNEIKNGYIQKSFPELAKLDETEVICVDFESTDGTQELIREHGFKLIESKNNSRAKRINEGIKAATGQLIVIHHPRSIVENLGLEYLRQNQNNIHYWGAFTHKFDIKHPLLKFTSFWSNYVRGDFKGIFYLDHCLFAPKSFLEKINYLREVEIFEDTLLSKKLKKISPYHRLPYVSMTSAIRFSSNGVWRQALLNQKMKLRFYFRFTHSKMNKDYEAGLNLNSEYKGKDRDGQS